VLLRSSVDNLGSWAQKLEKTRLAVKIRFMDLSFIISKKIRLAVDVCIFIASRGRSCRITSVQLSPKLGISISTLENILKSLKASRLIDSSKGPGGGFKICRHPTTISVWDIVVAFSEGDGGDDAEIRSVKRTPLASYELALQEVVAQTLRSFSLADFSYPEELELPDTTFYSTSNPFRLMSPEPSFIPNAPNSVFELAAFLNVKKT
jgi:Rrf2 family protein